MLAALGSTRRFWHDELYTLYIATAPSWSRFWQELQLDLNPPLEYLAVRVSSSVFGENELAIRLPSILAFLVASLCLWRFTKQRLDCWYGILAMLVFWASPFFAYSTEARPYAFVMAFFGMTLLTWASATEPQREPIHLLALAFAVCGMMMSHLMAVFYVLPFLAAEAVRIVRSRKFDAPLLGTLLLPCAVPFIYLHLVSRFEASVFPPVFRASVRKMAEAYYGSLKLEALPLLLGLGLSLFLISKFDKTRKASGKLSVENLALILGMLTIPILVNLALMRSHGAYFDRYGFPVSFGYALLCAFLLAKLTDREGLAAAVASTVLFLFVVAFQLGPGRKPSVWSNRHTVASLNVMEAVRPDLPLVAASGLTFLEMDHYEDARTTNRLYYLTDRELALRYASATIFEGMQNLKNYFPIRARVAGYSRFIKNHSEFLVLGTPDYPEDWLLRALLDQGAEVRFLGNFPGLYKDSQLYQVKPGVTMMRSN